MMDMDYVGMWYDDGIVPSRTELLDTLLALYENPDNFDFDLEDIKRRSERDGFSELLGDVYTVEYAEVVIFNVDRS